MNKKGAALSNSWKLSKVRASRLQRELLALLLATVTVGMHARIATGDEAIERAASDQRGHPGP